MIRDCIVVGLQDAALSEKLQLKPELTLEPAIAKVQLSELIKKQQPMVRGDEQKIKSRRACTLEDVGTTPRDKQNTWTRGMKPVSMHKWGKIPGHSQQNRPHVTSAKREDTCRKCVRLGK